NEDNPKTNAHQSSPAAGSVPADTQRDQESPECCRQGADRVSAPVRLVTREGRGLSPALHCPPAYGLPPSCNTRCATLSVAHLAACCAGWVHSAVPSDQNR